MCYLLLASKGLSVAFHYSSKYKKTFRITKTNVSGNVCKVAKSPIINKFKKCWNIFLSSFKNGYFKDLTNFFCVCTISAITILVFSTITSTIYSVINNFKHSNSVLQFFAIPRKPSGSLMISHCLCLPEYVGGFLVKVIVVSVFPSLSRTMAVYNVVFSGKSNGLWFPI